MQSSPNTRSLPTLPSALAAKLHLPTTAKSDLRTFVDKILLPRSYEEIKEKKSKNQFYMSIEIPNNVQPPWRFTKDICDIILDVLNEMLDTLDLTNITYEEFMTKYEAAMNIRDVPPDPKAKPYQKKFPRKILDNENEQAELQQVSYVLHVADMILSKMLQGSLS